MTTTLQDLSVVDKRNSVIIYDPDRQLFDSDGFGPKSCDTLLLHCHSGSEAMHYLNMFDESPVDDGRFSVIMPLSNLQKNNYALVRRVRSSRYLFNIPVVALSDTALSPAEQKQAIAAGIDDVFVGPAELSRVIKATAHIAHIRSLSSVIEPDTSNAGVILTLPWHKRAVDITLALIGLIPLSVLFVILAIAIKLDSKGPVFYSQWRRGMNGKKFRFWKFRSMYVDADQRLAELAHRNQYKGQSKFFKVENDPRITRVGRFIRNSSIDELPQIFNVLMGQMSIVGNRPLPLYEAKELTSDSAAERYLAPAGMTGLWQVTKRGGNELSDEERIGLDIKYARSYNFIDDLRIIYKTPRAMVQKSNV